MKKPLAPEPQPQFGVATAPICFNLGPPPFFHSSHLFWFDLGSCSHSSSRTSLRILKRRKSSSFNENPPGIPTGAAAYPREGCQVRPIMRRAFVVDGPPYFCLTSKTIPVRPHSTMLRASPRKNKIRRGQLPLTARPRAPVACGAPRITTNVLGWMDHLSHQRFPPTRCHEGGRVSRPARSPALLPHNNQTDGTVASTGHQDEKPVVGQRKRWGLGVGGPGRLLRCNDGWARGHF